MATLTLRPINIDNWREALTLEVLPEQQRFVTDYVPVVLVALAKSYVGARGMSWTPLGIYGEEQLVGFVALASPTDRAEVCWIFHFFIDHRLQRRGYGRSGLATVLQHVRESRPACRSLMLTVHPENTVAQQLYRQAGFAPTGTHEFGEPAYRLQL